MKNIYWKRTVGTLIGSIWLYTLADIAVSITGAVNAILNPSGAWGIIRLLMNGGNFNNPYQQLWIAQGIEDMMNTGDGGIAVSMGDMIEGIFSILVFVGYYLFFRSLTRFAGLQSNWRDKESVSTVRSAYILLIAAILVGFIPLIGGLASFIIIIISYVKLLSGYRDLKKSTTFPARAREGAATLYSCTIWTLVGYVLGCIPLIGSFIEGLITLIVFISVLGAWKRIKEAAPEMTPEEEERFEREEVPAPVQKLGDGLVVLFGIMLISKVFWFTVGMGWTSVALNTSLLCGAFGELMFFVLYLWMLCSKTLNLSIVAKSGLSILLLLQLYYLLNLAISMGLISETWRDYLSDWSIPLVFWLIPLLAISVFIIASNASKALKIVLPLFYLIRLVWFLMADILRENWYSIAGYDPNDWKVNGSFARFQNFFWLLLILLFFFLVVFFVRKWKQDSVRNKSLSLRKEQPEVGITITDN